MTQPFSPRTWIKICGIRTAEDAAVAAQAGADAIGLMLAERSPRCITFHEAVAIVESLPSSVKPIAVFADAPIERISAWPGDWVQLHGDEDETLIIAVASSHRVIRGFCFDPAAVRRWEQCEGISALLVDGSTGGGGTMFDHGLLREMISGLRKPVILAGGLTPENVADAIRAVRPWAVDVSSGVERERGVKDHEKIRAFCAAVRAADASLD